MKRTWFIVLVMVSAFAMGATNLSPGQIVVLSTNGDGNDGFSFMSLVDLEVGTKVHFTDVGWNKNPGEFKATNDGGADPLNVLGAYGVCTYTVPLGGLTAGVVVSQNSTNINSNFSAYTLESGFNSFPYISTFGISYGDQCIVFQGTFSSPTFIWALSYMDRVDDGNIHDWTINGEGDASGLDDGNSDLPTGLTNGVNAIVVPSTLADDYDNGWYSGPTTEVSAEEWAARVVNPSNWSFTDDLDDGDGDLDYVSLVGNIYSVTADAPLPIELASFSVQIVNGSVVLEWATESETENLGYMIEREDDNSGSWSILASYQTHEALQGQGTCSGRHEYSFRDDGVESGKNYTYRLSDVSEAGNIIVHPPIMIELGELAGTGIEKIYPNPFNPQTYIAYHLQEDTDVAISVYDISGRIVNTLLSGHQVAGNYHLYWNGNNNMNDKVASGSYIIHMQTENNSEFQKVVFVK